MLVMCAVPAFMITRELLAGVDDRRRGDRVRRIDPAGQDVDVVLRQQFLRRDAGVVAARVLGVALDQRDLVGLHLVGVELEIDLHAAVDQLRELGADAGVRQVDAHLHLLRVGQASPKWRARPKPRERVSSSKSLPKVTEPAPLRSSGFGPDIRSKAQIGASEWPCCGVRLFAHFWPGILIAQNPLPSQSMKRRLGNVPRNVSAFARG